MTDPTTKFGDRMFLLGHRCGYQDAIDELSRMIRASYAAESRDRLNLLLALTEHLYSRKAEIERHIDETPSTQEEA